jgi:hypothetical protein
MHIAWLEIGTREYDLEYLRQLEEYLATKNINIKWSNKAFSDNTREFTATERIKINIEIARIKNKWRITAAA